MRLKNMVKIYNEEKVKEVYEMAEFLGVEVIVRLATEVSRTNGCLSMIHTFFDTPYENVTIERNYDNNEYKDKRATEYFKQYYISEHSFYISIVKRLNELEKKVKNEFRKTESFT